MQMNHIQLCDEESLLKTITDRFPLNSTPYKQQINLMQEVIRSLNHEQNGLFESPTGTGKTLCMLCSSLQWQEEQKKLGNKIKIFYASRTHDQLNQVIEQLLKTQYRPKVAVRGSKNKYCINEDAQYSEDIQSFCFDQKNNTIDGCPYKIPKQVENYEIKNQSQLREFGKQQLICPYYLEKLKYEDADLVLLPYDYLLSKSMFLLDLKNVVIIFDEGHNIPSKAQDAFNIVLNEKSLQKAIDELEKLKKILKLRRDNGQIPQLQLKNIKIDIKTIIEFILHTQQQFKKEELSKICKEDSQSKINNLFDFIFQNTENVQQLKQYFINIKVSCKKFVKPINFNKLYYFINDLYNLVRGNENRFINCFALDLEEKNRQKLIQLTCLTPQYAFNKFKRTNYRQILLISGTLTPFQYIEDELGVDFQKQFINDYLDGTQSRIRAFQYNGMNLKQIENDNQGIERKKLYTLIGQKIITLLPHIPGGVLVFLSSYKNLKRFQESYQQLQGSNNVKAFWDSQTDYKKNQRDLQDKLFPEYTKEILDHGWAILFIVHRGVMSEGKDFKDNLCRAIFLIEVPYLSPVDEKIKQKKKVLDFLFDNNYSRQNGQQWYNNQAIMTTNQAIGRVLRHKEDYGMVYFIDNRFSWGTIHNGLPNIVKNTIKQWYNNNDNKIIQETQQFFDKFNHTQQIQQDIKQLIPQQQYQSQQSQYQKQQFQSPQKDQNQATKKPKIILKNNKSDQKQQEVYEKEKNQFE